MRLRTGHRLNDRMYRKLMAVPSLSNLPVWSRRPITEHFLRRYPLRQAARQDVRPTDTPLTTALYACGQEQEKMTTFITTTERIV